MLHWVGMVKHDTLGHDVNGQDILHKCHVRLDLGMPLSLYPFFT